MNYLGPYLRFFAELLYTTQLNCAKFIQFFVHCTPIDYKRLICISENFVSLFELSVLSDWSTYLRIHFVASSLVLVWAYK